MQKLFSSLADVQFRHFWTPQIAQLVYLLAVGFFGLLALVMLLTGFRQGAAVGAIMALASLLGFILCMAFTRMFLEMCLAVLRITGYAAELARATRKNQPADEAAEPATSSTPSHQF